MTFLPFDDPRWESFNGGYRIPYDPRPALRRLLSGDADDAVWEELWEGLHHQSDADFASYAAVPCLAESITKFPRLDRNPLGIIAVIETERSTPRNPTIPSFLRDAYFGAIDRLPAIIAAHPDRNWSDETFAPAMACIALARGHRGLARAYLEAEPVAFRAMMAHHLDLDLQSPEGRAQLDDLFKR